YVLLYGAPKPTAVLFPLVMAAFFPLLLGVGWLLSALGVVVRDIGQLTGLLAHALLFLTPIFYGIDAVPAFLRDVLLANPLTFVVEQLRQVLYMGRLPNVGGLALYFVLSGAFAWLSLAIFRRLRPRFADLV